MHYAERELFRYTKGSVREHNLLKNQFVHTKFLLNRDNSLLKAKITIKRKQKKKEKPLFPIKGKAV